MKANVADVGADTAFPHTENFFLLDTNRVIRGWYNGFDTTKLAQLAKDIPTIMLERGKSPCASSSIRSASNCGDGK